MVESSLKRGRGSKVGARISCSSPSKMLMMMILVMMMLSGTREVARINCLSPDHDKDEVDEDKKFES